MNLIKATPYIRAASATLPNELTIVSGGVGSSERLQLLQPPTPRNTPGPEHPPRQVSEHGKHVCEWLYMFAGHMLRQTPFASNARHLLHCDGSCETE